MPRIVRQSTSQSNEAEEATERETTINEPARRTMSSNSVINHTLEHNVIQKAFDSTKSMIDSCIERINQNAEGVDEVTLARWRQQLETIITSLGNLENRDKIVDQVIREVLEKYLHLDVEDLIEVEETQIVQEVQRLTVNRAEKAAESTKITNFRTQLNPAPVQGQNDDLIIQDDGGINENKIKCPYTQQIMTEPMKNENGRYRCIHHVSRQGLQSSVRNSAFAKCPIFGCTGRWTLATSVLDESFQQRITRFLRRKEKESQLLEGTSTRDILDIEENDDDL